MSRSVVLNLDKSIALAEKYWQSLRDAAVSTSEAVGWNGKLSEKSLAYPLMYYHKDSIESVMTLVNTLEQSLSGHVYDFQTIAKIVDSGIGLPKNADYAGFQVDRLLLSESLELIECAWPAGFREMLAYTTGFVIIDGNSIRSLTGPAWFGAIFLGKVLLDRKRIDDMATSILHEVGHLALYAQSAVDSPMDDLKQEVYSPFVKRARPAIMVFHAQIALARMIVWLFGLKKFMIEDPRSSKFSDRISLPRIENSIRKYTECYLEAMNSVRLVKPTHAGEDLLSDFEGIEKVLKALKI